jgi:branched-subunit amino acid aminotransferase/4-amino-4-deoxychorismate lyase
MEFLISNSKIIGKDEINLNHILTESTFSFSQKVWYGYGDIPLFAENLEQIKVQAEALKLNLPKEFENRRELQRLTKRMLNKNKFYRSGYIDFQFFWTKNQVHTLITANACQEFDFPFSENGLLATFSIQKKLSQNPFNRFPFFNKMLWAAGIAEIQRSSFQQIIFLNENNSLCEFAFANIFLVKGKELLTPALSTGCYNDILRPHVLETAKLAGLQVLERSRIEESKIFEMDEIFLASENRGFQWILGIGNKRFLHHYSKKIHEVLLKKLKLNS